MPWERRFDTDEALAQAMRAFWARGYEATSVQDLLACMGINRGSLYATFGDKRSLFIQALDRYDAHHRRAWTLALRASYAPRQAILAAFEQAIAAAVSGSKDGCLLVNTALELAPHDPKVAGLVGRSFEEMEIFFRDMIEQGQKAGEIPGHVVPADTARALLGLFLGLRVLSRSRPDEPVLRSIGRQAEALLG